MRKSVRAPVGGEASLVIFLQAGFALVDAGLTRGRSTAETVMENVADFGAGAGLGGGVRPVKVPTVARV